MAAKKKEGEAKKRTPRNQPLPGMEDAPIQALEDKALEYVDVRDERIKLSRDEGERKKELLALMKAQKREHYHHENISIDIVHEKENVKVKVKAAGIEVAVDDDEEE